jgi:D-apionolactonase
VTCRMEGDTFEMEDQRNWTDASYKTYVRPLALPWPYTLAKGERISQRVALTVTASFNAALPRRSERVGLSFARTGAMVPPLGFGLDPKDIDETLRAAGRLRLAGPHQIILSYDPGLGHDAITLARLVEAGSAVGGELWLEAVVRSLDGFEEEIAELGRTVKALGSPFRTILVSPAPDLKCTLPGSPWPACPSLANVYTAARQAFQNARLGGGMFSFFTELNRKRPPVDLLDLVTFTSSAIFHAGDDRSATEGLESLPAIAKTVRSFIQDRPYHVGPSAIGMRANPYGEAPTLNPANIRQAGNGMDPRQRGLLCAAWTVGYFAHFVRGGASAVTLGAGVGDFGLLHTKGPYAKPWYDETGGFYPVFHVFKGLSALCGQTSIDVQTSRRRIVQAVGSVVDGEKQVFVANLTGQDQEIELPETSMQRVSLLDQHSFVAASQDPDWLDASERPLADRHLRLGPYAVARLRD